MLPHIRAPAGHHGAISTAASARRVSFRRTCRKGFPTWLKRVEVPKKDGTVHHPLVTDTRSLLWLANQNSITPHVWTSRVAGPVPPRYLRLRSRPARDDEPDVLRAAALALRDLLAELGLPSWVKTSGSKGFHIVVPLDGKADFGEVARFAHAVGDDSRQARSGAPHAGVQQGRSRRAHPRRHRPQRLQRDVRRGVRRARRSLARQFGAMHVGGARTRRGAARGRSRCARWPAGSPRSATSGRTCEGGADRCDWRSTGCARKPTVDRAPAAVASSHAERSVRR